jgi:hypothetical protein
MHVMYMLNVCMTHMPSVNMTVCFHPAGGQELTGHLRLPRLTSLLMALLQTKSKCCS